VAASILTNGLTPKRPALALRPWTPSDRPRSPETRPKIRPRSLPSATCPNHLTMCDTDKQRYATRVQVVRLRVVTTTDVNTNTAAEINSARRWCSYVQLYCDWSRMLLLIHPFKAQWSLYVCTAMFNIRQFSVLPTHCIYVFCVDLRTNSHYFPIQH
jgi:hypothetical protein